MSNVKISENLINLREIKGMSKKDIAQFLDVHETTYGKYELGKRSPDYETLLKLADYFNCTIDYLVGRVDEPNLVHYELPDVDGMKIAVDIVQDALNEGLSPEDIKKVVALAKDMKNNSKKD